MGKLLENEQIRLRALEPEDLETLYLWENDPDNWIVSNTLIPFSRYSLKEFIKQSSADIFETRQLRLMITLISDEQPVGAIDLFDLDPFHRRAGVGILIHRPENRNKGYATLALGLLKEYSFNHLKLHQLYCNIASSNQASLKVFIKNGFRIIGEKKDWQLSPEGYRGELMLQCIGSEGVISE